MWGRRAVTLLLALLLIPGIVLTLVRLLDPWDGRWVRLEAFTPFGIVAYGAALVVVLIRFAFARGWATGIAAAAVAVGLALHLSWFAPMVTGDNPPPREGAGGSSWTSASGPGVATKTSAGRSRNRGGSERRSCNSHPLGGRSFSAHRVQRT